MERAPYPGLHPDLWDLVRDMAADPDPVPDHLRPIAALREGVARMEAAMPPLPPDVMTQDWTMPVAGREVPMRSYAVGAPRGAAMLYIHGGGWSLGTLRGHDLVCADIARDTGLRVVSIEYALAPEHPYPTALNECVAAFDAVAAGASPLGEVGGLWLGGDSAGGNLALATAAQRGGAGVFLVYPATDPACRAESYTIHAEAPYLSAAMMHRCWQDYLGGQVPDPVPDAVNLSSVPKAVILTAALDPLLGDGEALAAPFLAASKPVWYERAEGLIHGFLRFRAASPASDAAFRRATTALSAML